MIIEQDHEYYDTLDETKDTQLKEALNYSSNLNILSCPLY